MLKGCGAMPTFDNVLVTGNQTINQQLQVDGNETVGGMLQVNSNQTVMGSMQVNTDHTVLGDMQVVGDQTVAGNSAVGGIHLVNGDTLVLGSVNAGSTINAVYRLSSVSQATTPGGGFSAQQVRFYPAILAGQPGLVLKGTDGNNYVLFVDVSGGVPNLGIMKA